MAGTLTTYKVGAQTQLQAVDTTIAAMDQTMSLAQQNATQVQGGMQQIATTTTTTMLAEIAKAG